MFLQEKMRLFLTKCEKKMMDENCFTIFCKTKIYLKTREMLLAHLLYFLGYILFTESTKKNILNKMIFFIGLIMEKYK